MRAYKVLALDTGTKTGFAIGYPDDKIESGVQDFSLKRGESAGMRFIIFRAWLEKIITATAPDLIVYEQAHHRGGAATDLCVGMTTRIVEIAALHDINCTSCHSAKLKKFATGSGRASKEDMIVAAEKLTGIKPQDDNEADALCLLAFAREEYEPKVEKSVRKDKT